MKKAIYIRASATTHRKVKTAAAIAGVSISDWAEKILSEAAESQVKGLKQRVKV